MARIVWTDQALSDLDAISQFIEREAPRHAELLTARVFLAIDRLAPFPYSGRVVPEFGQDDVREVIVRGYRVVYRIESDDVKILTGHHGARLLGDLSDR